MVFLSDSVVLALLFLILVGLLVLLAIQRGLYNRLTQAPSKIVRTLNDIAGTQQPEKPKPQPAVVELAPRTPLPARGTTGRPKSSASETLEMPNRLVPPPAQAPQHTAKEIKEIEKTDLGRAALLWQKISCWEQAADCYFKLGNPMRSASIWLALDQSEKALPMLRDALKSEDDNETVRLRLVETLFDLGREDEARQLIDEYHGKNGDGQNHESAAYLESLGRNYEAKRDHEKAIAYYQQALGKDSGPRVELQNRIQLLDRMQKLITEPAALRESNSASQQLLEKYVRESNVTKAPSDKESGSATTESRQLAGHEIIVGHLATGFQQFEPPRSIRSVYSLSRRFEMEKLLGESSRGMVYLAVDGLLDFQVALRIYRLSDNFGKLEILKERLRAISHLNHPNLAKITFVDREGPIIRVATEYLPGGNLREFLTKLGGVGLPLIIRMSMHLASALHTAHVKGIPHGDLRPENLIIGPDQRIKLLDFAISPLPVATFDLGSLNVTDNSETPRPFDFAAHNEGVQSDLLQFAEVIEFMLQHARRTVDPVASGVNDTTGELTELVSKVRSGGYTTVLKLWQTLEQIFDRTLPSQSGSGEKPRG
ncbi:protein kinase [Candidatus Sumerlaeota bacterium]|nr:protein kinase [Candidatus Sumerlaeota bacterium]